jgi:tetratricopeptide (TPR) repeat protein
MLAKCMLAKKNFAEAEKYALSARAAYPQEPQALHVSGMARIGGKKFEGAYADFNEYEQILPGNPNTVFYAGYALEGLNRKDNAAQKYKAYLSQVNEGDNARHAHRKLVEWGYIVPQVGK